MNVTAEPTWNAAEPYNVMVEIKITELGDLRLWLNRIKISIGLYVEQDLLVNRKFTRVGDTYSICFTLQSDSAFKYVKPGDISTYALSVDVTGEVAYELFGKTYTLSGWTYESFDIKVYAPPSPITIVASLPPEIIVYGVFNLTVTITNDGNYPITNIEVEVSEPFRAKLIGDKTLTLNRLEPKANGTFIFRLNATLTGDASTTVYVSYTSISGYDVSWLTFPFCKKDVAFSIISPPAPTSISVSMPARVTLNDEFNVSVSLVNDGDYRISDIEVYPIVVATSVISEHPLTLASLEPKKTATFTFQLKATSPGNWTISFYVSYWSIGRDFISKSKDVQITISKLPSLITCRVVPEKVIKGGNVTISGAISVPTRAFLTFTFRKPDGTWMERMIVSTVDGLFNYTFAPDLAGSWTVKTSWIGDLEHEAATSETVSFAVKILTTISVSVSKTTVTEGDEVTVSGSIEPTPGAVNVTLTYTKPDGTILKRTVTSTSAGSYTDTWKPTPKGTWSVKASWTGSETHEGATSSTPSFTVKEKGCIIATATYGSELSKEVQYLRGFRDTVVLSTFAGSHFMELFNAWYYSFSPGIAEFISEHAVLKSAIKVLLYPLMGILHLSARTYSLFSFNGEVGVVMAGLVASGLIGVLYFSPSLTILLLIFKHLQNILRMDKVRLLAVPWFISLVLIFIGEFSLSSTVMMAATGMFVLVTITLSALIISIGVCSKWARLKR